VKRDPPGDARLEDTGEHPATRGEMRRAFRINEIFTFLVASMTAVGAVFGAYKLLLSEARAEADAGVAVHESRIKALEQQVPQLREEVYQGRLDTQALYKALMERKRQDRLEKPPPKPTLDGGSP
jgi:cytochrome c-type biogenesis protein CcmH/NrfG